MGLFTSKIFLGVIAGGFTLAGAGLVFTGHDTLQNANSYVQDASAKLVQFQSNQDSLVGKIGQLKTDSNTKITAANGTIAQDNQAISDLTAKKADLESQLAAIQTNITALQGQLASATGDLATTKKALDDETAKYNSTQDQLNKANATIQQDEEAAQDALAKSKQADGLVAQLEGEIQKANADVAQTGQVVDKAKQDTQNVKPMTNDEVGAVDTTTVNVAK
jgi:chromosome segregation ATPase